MVKKITCIVLVLLFYSIGFSQMSQVEKELKFTPAEVESMLFLYNQTSVKGADVEVVAPVGVKLRDGLTQARTLNDTTQKVILKVTAAETQICLQIIQNSTFEAKYAELVLGMKNKLVKLLPPPPPNAQPALKKP
jgi:hypothetical protein